MQFIAWTTKGSQAFYLDLEKYLNFLKSQKAKGFRAFRNRMFWIKLITWATYLLPWDFFIFSLVFWLRSNFGGTIDAYPCSASVDHIIIWRKQKKKKEEWESDRARRRKREIEKERKKERKKKRKREGTREKEKKREEARKRNNYFDQKKKEKGFERNKRLNQNWN